MGLFFPTGKTKLGDSGVGTSKNLIISYSPSVKDGTPAFTIYHSPIAEDDCAPTLQLYSGVNVLGNSHTISRKEIGKFLSLLYNDGEMFYVDSDGMVDAQGSVTGGAITVPTGNQTVDMESGNYFESTPAGDGTWTTKTGRKGQIAIINIDNAGSHIITFGTGFTDVDAVSKSGIQVKLLYYDGDIWREIKLGSGGGDGGGPFPWQFKMVDAGDFATPKPGKSPVVKIAKNGVPPFVSLDGDPEVIETGSGWYVVWVSVADQAYKVIVLMATASGCAQTDGVYYF